MAGKSSLGGNRTELESGLFTPLQQQDSIGWLIVSADEKPGWPSLYNPGSIGRPRGDNGPTYGVLLLERGEKPRFQLCPVPPKA